jgi:hypothetical protein
MNSKFLEEQRKRSGWSVRPGLFENQLTCCEVREMDDDDDDNNKV